MLVAYPLAPSAGNHLIGHGCIMPFVPNSTINERIGVYYTGYVLSLANVIFRESSNTDVGIDAQIELVDEKGNATGKLAGLQIKSGDSFVDIEKELFTLRAERKHFNYWSRYILPVIGIVFSPSLNKAVWFDLTEHSYRIIEQEGPYRVTEVLSAENELNHRNVSCSLVPLLQQFYGVPVSAKNVELVAKLQEEPKETGQTIDQESKETAWKRLTNILLASKSSPEVLADAGHRVSWYFPSVPQIQRDFFIERIKHASDQELANLIKVIHYLLSLGADDTAELICDLFAYLPLPANRLKHLARERIVPAEELEALFQSVEFFTQKFEGEFREEILRHYGITVVDLP